MATTTRSVVIIDLETIVGVGVEYRVTSIAERDDALFARATEIYSNTDVVVSFTRAQIADIGVGDVLQCTVTAL